MRFLLLDLGLKKVIRGLRGLGGELLRSPPLGDQAEVVVDLADDAGLFPSLTLGGILCGGLVGLPAAFGEDPAAAPGRLDEQDVVLVGRERDDASNEAFTLRAVACKLVRNVRNSGARVLTLVVPAGA